MARDLFEEAGIKPGPRDLFADAGIKTTAKSSDPTEGMSGTEKFIAGVGKAFVDLGRGTKQLLAGSADVDPNVFIGTAMPHGPKRDALVKKLMAERQSVISGIQEDIDESKRLDAPLMNTGAGTAGNIAGNVAAVVPSSMLPGGNTLAGSAVIGSVLGALQPVAEGDSRLKNTLIGGASSAAGYGVGKLAGKVVNSAASKVANIEKNVAAKAAAEAASETASARSAAGNAAQNAYRQLEHLRELGSLRALTPEEAQVAALLEKELSEKSIEKLLPAAAQKEATSAAYKEAIETEAQRAADIAAKRLSNSEVKNQIMARVKRYGPAAVGGVIGNMLFPGLGGSVGGAATGLVLRPAARSMVNLAKNPAVQHKVLSPIASATPVAHPAVPNTLAYLLASINAGQE